MKSDLKKRWLKALRGGRFRQGKGGLFEDDRYCCLGVLCHVKTGAPPKVEPFNYYSKFKPFGLDEESIEHLCLQNDQGDSFKQIALWIEKNL